MILKILNKIKKQKDLNGNEWDIIMRTAAAMKETSLCALGQSAIMPISSAYTYFKDELENQGE
ncbi:MAG: hypothetical protein GWP03_04990 [Proteobacteria bacterium]|nr:hypothetical protein [Pseudomonadota bacterium]